MPASGPTQTTIASHATLPAAHAHLRGITLAVLALPDTSLSGSVSLANTIVTTGSMVMSLQTCVCSAITHA